MAISYGPKLGLINNAAIGENYTDAMRQFLQALDTLIQMSVISTAVISPPSTPNNGDAYLLITGTPSGAWTGYSGYIAVWDTQVTTSGTNTQVPQWVFYKPNAGWSTWVISSGSFLIYNGVSWTPLIAGNIQAEAPTGAINGSNITYILTYTPFPTSSLQLFINGVFQIPVDNYNVNATVITMNVAPNSGSTVYAVYQYV
jgi:Protein of unknown function (DUF2793)